MSLPEHHDDMEQLIARVAVGDEQALTEILTRYESRIRTAARVLLGPLLRPHLDSLDRVQSVHRVLLPALRGGKYQPLDSQQLITLVRRKVARQWRHLRLEQDLQNRAGQRRPAEPHGLALSSPRSRPDRRDQGWNPASACSPE